MKKTILILTILFSSLSLFSQETNQISNLKTQTGFGQLDYFSIKMPNNDDGISEKNMGFTGIHYNLMLNDWSYAGVGLYGAVSGIRGGFFTLGLNAGIKKNIIANLFIDTGIHIGGGGGASAPDGGGAYIIPHVNLGYDFKYFSATAGWNYINFFDNGNIKSHQLNVAFQIPLSFNYNNFKERERQFSINALKNTKWNQPTNRLSLLVHLNNLSPEGKSKFTDGASLNNSTIRLAGFELNSYFNKNMFFFVKADGAYKGIRAGYMDVLVGAGYHFSMNKDRTNILAKFGVGAGGGGGVDTKGGVLIYPDVSIEQKLGNNLYASINKGYLMSPDSEFKASTLGFGLKYYIDKDGTTSEGKTFRTATYKGLQIILKQDMYLNAARIGGSEQHLHQISLQFNFFLNEHLYAAGQTSFANFGNAGAYAEGIIGFGGQTAPLWNDKITAFVQVLGGAAGGGGVSTGEGLLIKPSAGINYFLNDKLNLRAAAGYVKSRGNGLSSPFVNIGVSYNFSFLSAKEF